MKRTLLISASLLLATTAPVAAQQSATQLVRFRVIALQQLAVQQPPKPMAPRAGEAAVSTATYDFSTNESNRKISASLDQPMPHGSSLVVAMAAPAGGQSAGETTLGTGAVDMVTAIPASESSGLPLRYSVRTEAALHRGEQRTITYTVTAAP